MQLETIRRRGVTVRRATALLGAALLAATSVIAISAAAAGADPIGDCTASSGAVVAVDFSHFGGTVERGCDAHPSTGYNLLHDAGFHTTGTQHDGPTFICRIGLGNGAQYPRATDEPCTATPSATAYWSYWIAPAGQRSWTYSTLGAQGDVPAAGEVAAWVYGDTDIAGSTGAPSFTPDSVRAGGAASAAAPTSSAPVKTAIADLPGAATYLTGQLTGGDHVDDGSGGNSYPQSVNVALGLAALGGQDATLRKLVTALQAHIADYVYSDGTSAPPAPDAAANLALLDEVTGGDPSALLTALTGNVCTAAGSSGACTAAGDFHGAAHPHTQALAILALVRGGVTPPAATVSRLERIQCTDGSFAGLMRNPGDACDPDVSTTATAILALKGVSGAEAVVSRAVEYLDGAQQIDGSYLPHPGASGGDTGTTGLAAQALLATGHTSQAGTAANWLAGRQNADGGLSADGTATDSDLYASTDAVLALAGKHLDTLTRTVQTAPSSSSVAAPSSPATSTLAAPTDRTPDLSRGTSYLVAPATLLGGQYYEAFAGSGFADFGLTLDGAFALAASGKNNAALAKIVGFIATGKDGNGRSIGDWTSIGTPYASGGSLGKQALLAEVTGYDPTDFGGQNLITALDSTVCAAATTSADTVCAGMGNYANSTSVFSQALGIMAQLRAGDTAGAASPISYLEGLQKASGAWPSLIPDSGDSDVDSTAMALMALSLVPGTEAAVAKGIAWIATQQQGNGGFLGAAGDSTNSAALAIQGLSLDKATYAAPIAKALTFLAGQQNTDGGFNVASAGQRGSDIRASAQVVSGATGISFGTLSRDVHGGASAAAGAKYLVSQLVDGDHLVNPYGPDNGLTADLAIALAATNTQDTALTRVVRYLSAHVADYADPAGTSSYPGPSSGAVAKLALIAEITGQKPTTFGGFNLLKTLTDHVCTAADTAGSCTAAGDFYQSFSSVSQSLAVLALARAGVTPPAAAVSRLASLQCPDGGFSSLLIAAGATCTSDVDSTGYALQALLLVPSEHAAAQDAEAYLLAAQQHDGGYVGAAGENSNSTALAIQGLLAADRAALVPSRVLKALVTGPAAVAAGKEFLYPLQNANGGFGINADSPESDARSTTQAVSALAGATLGALSDPLTITSTPGRGGSSNAPTSGSRPSGSSSGTAVAGAGSGNLAFTGSQPITLLELAILLLLGGGGAVLLGRRRPATARRH